MRRMRAFCVCILGVFVRKRREGDLSAELDSHQQLHIDDNVRAGMTPGEARRRALVALGGVEQTKGSVRDARGTFLDSIRRDAVFALRLMRRSPGVTAMAVLSLAMGIGANTAFSAWRMPCSSALSPSVRPSGWSRSTQPRRPIQNSKEPRIPITSNTGASRKFLQA